MDRITDLKQNVNECNERLMLVSDMHDVQPEDSVFCGDPIDCQTFIRAFENLIEANTDSNSARLYYLIQYTQGDVKELMKSCLSMKGEEGYAEARRLLKTWPGLQNRCIVR